MSLKEEYFNYILKESKMYSRRISKKEYSKKELRDFKKQFDKSYADKNTYTTISYINDKLETLVFAKKVDNPFVGKCIATWGFHCKTENLKTEIKKIKEFYKSKKIPIYFDVDPYDKKKVSALLKNGAQITAFKLRGSVSSGLKYVRKKGIELNTGFSIGPAIKKEVAQLVAIEVDVHSREKTLLNQFPKKARESLRKHMLEIIKRKSLFVIREGKKPIAHVGYWEHEGMAHMSTIAVAKEYQGQGLSHLLYEKVFEDLKARKIKVYTGVTITKRTLSLGKKMGRVSYLYKMKMP